MSFELYKNLVQRVCVGDIFRRRAKLSGNKEGVVEVREDKEIRLTFRELNSCLNNFVWKMREIGVKKGDRVGLIGPNSTEYLICLYGCGKGGFEAVPINPLLNPNDLLYVLTHSEVKVIIFDDRLYPHIKDHIPKLDFIEKFVSLPIVGHEVLDNVLIFDPLIVEKEDEIEDVIIEDRDNFEILYTSGTTSRPKGVQISHLSVFLMSLSNLIELDITKPHVATTIMPLFHCAQQTLTISLFHIGGKSVIFPSFDPEKLLKAIDKEKIEFIFCLPMMYKTLLDHPLSKDVDLSSLKKCIYAMTPMDGNTLKMAKERFGSHVEFILGTGQTECFPSTNCFKDQWQLKKMGNYWGESALVLDTAIMDESGNILGPGEIGEIVWRGPGTMNGYLKNEEETKKTWEYGWHHSGDLGYFDEDGLLVFVDRKKDMIKTGGENVPSIKVERVILSHPKVVGAAVVGLPHPRWIEAITAFVEPMPGEDIDPQEIIDLCKKELSPFEVPKEVIISTDLPKTATGKLQKNILREKYKDIYKDLYKEES
ncbi:acyl-CoA synthetase [Desulfothermus okinawensis JCM 13304]